MASLVSLANDPRETRGSGKPHDPLDEPRLMILEAGPVCNGSQAQIIMPRPTPRYTKGTKLNDKGRLPLQTQALYRGTVAVRRLRL